jgi:hypothetical protein
MPTFTYRGLEGELRYGWHQAAVLGSWTMTTTPSGLALTATVVSQHALWMSQSPLTFRVNRQHALPWVWSVESLQIESGTLTAKLTQTE